MAHFFGVTRLHRVSMGETSVLLQQAYVYRLNSGYPSCQTTHSIEVNKTEINIASHLEKHENKTIKAEASNNDGQNVQQSSPMLVFLINTHTQF